MSMMTQPFLTILLLLHNCLNGKDLHIVLCIHIVYYWIFNVINSSQMNNLNLFNDFQGRRKIFKNNKMFFKNQGHNEFWYLIQGQFLALKDVWQPYSQDNWDKLTETMLLQTFRYWDKQQSVDSNIIQLHLTLKCAKIDLSTSMTVSWFQNEFFNTTTTVWLNFRQDRRNAWCVSS